MDLKRQVILHYDLPYFHSLFWDGNKQHTPTPLQYIYLYAVNITVYKHSFCFSVS